MKPSPYAGIIRIRLKGSALAISAIMGTPDFYAVFIRTLYYKIYCVSRDFKNYIRFFDFYQNDLAQETYPSEQEIR
jgi:uncharacterized protein Usg